MSAVPCDIGDLGARPMPRSMQRVDLDQIVAIENRAYEFPWSRNVFMVCFGEGYEGRVLELEREVMGYAIILLDVEVCHVVNLCIDPPFQRRGFGRGLLRLMLDHAASCGAKHATLEVRASDAAAYALYASENFIKLSLRRNYYPTAGGNEDAVVMAKRL